MKKIDLQAETNLLLAKWIIKRNSSGNDIIQWALLLMENGYCSQNLYILAGLDSSDLWMLDSYFKKTLEDFNIESSIQENDLLDFYLIYHIKRILDSPEILTIDIIRSLGEIINDTSYSSNKHLDFFFLYDELDELTGMSKEEYAISEFNAFINELKSEK